MTNAEGVYNATLALLHYDTNGQPLQKVGGQARSQTPALLDYRPPAPRPCFDHGCIPPVWISVVAQDALWPIGYAMPADRRPRRPTCATTRRWRPNQPGRCNSSIKRRRALAQSFIPQEG